WSQSANANRSVVIVRKVRVSFTGFGPSGSCPSWLRIITPPSKPGKMPGFVANCAQEVVTGPLPLSMEGLRRPGRRTVRPPQPLVARCAPHLACREQVPPRAPDQRVWGGLQRLAPAPGAGEPCAGALVWGDHGAHVWPRTAHAGGAVLRGGARAGGGLGL